jgi:hypothetical protein
MIRQRVAAAVLAVAAGVGVAVAAAEPATAVDICEQYGTATVQDRYIVQNNRWGADTAQCISTTPSGFRVTRAEHSKATNGPPASYPSIYYGWHYGNASPGTVLPLPVTDPAVAALRTSVSYTFVSGATYNAAYDIWLDPTPRTDGQNTGAEIMVWANRQGSIQPIGSRVGTANLLGTTWEVWFGNVGWNVVSYVRSTPAPSLSFGVTTFVDDAVARGHAQRSWYLTSVQAGFEPWIGGAGLGVDDFSVTIGVPTSPSATPSVTPTPGPTPTATVPSGAACHATARVVNSWPGGFQAEVSVANTGTSPLAGWTVTGPLAAGQTVTQSWNAAVTTDGGTITARNLAYNGGVPGGAATTYGYVAGGPATAPALACAAR